MDWTHHKRPHTDDQIKKNGLLEQEVKELNDDYNIYDNNIMEVSKAHGAEIKINEELKSGRIFVVPAPSAVEPIVNIHQEMTYNKKYLMLQSPNSCLSSG